MSFRETPLAEANIRKRLSTKLLGRQIHVYQRVGSTNDVALRLASEGHPEGTVVVSDEQTHGRGRYGRTWHSRGGVGLWFSVLLRPRGHARLGWLLPLAASLSVAEALRLHFGISAQTKWPNDVVAARRKIAGVLVEGQVAGEKQSRAVVGIGVNVNHRPEDFPPALRDKATSAFQLLGKELDRIEVLVRVLEALERIYFQAVRDERPVLRDWLASCAHVNRLVSVATAEGPVTGRFLGVDNDGRLELRDASGEHVHIVARDLEILEEWDVSGH